MTDEKWQQIQVGDTIRRGAPPSGLWLPILPTFSLPVHNARVSFRYWIRESTHPLRSAFQNLGVSVY